MLLRFGYDIAVSCGQETPMICMMSVRDELVESLRVQSAMMTTPSVATTSYRDLFGNTCRRMVAQPGMFSLTSDCTIELTGLPDPVQPWLKPTPLADLRLIRWHRLTDSRKPTLNCPAPLHSN